MRREQTLLERISAMGGQQSLRAHTQSTTEEDLGALMDSIRRHLTRLINARHDFCEAQPEYGLPALTDLTIGSGDYVQAIQDAIRVAIEKYEPRLKQIRVLRVVDDDARQRLSFSVEAIMISRSGEHRVYYETSISGNGQFDVME